ncbi:ABC transporter ATP-binding protein [Candidatus Riflebacteria bacterium]
MNAIETSNLCKNFGDFNALSNIDIAIPPGQIVGFIGPNGAGKTTTMRILSTLELPSEGDAKIMGISCLQFPEKVRKLLGFMPDFYGTYPHTTVYEYLDFFARTRFFSTEERKKRIAIIMEYTELESIADRLIDNLSKGMIQRVSLGRVLIHDPQVLILDEPAAGLDPRARIELRDLLRLLTRKKNKTIFISSHILTELSEICDSVVLIDTGKIRKQGKISELVEEIENNGKRGVLLSIKVMENWESLQKFLLEQPFIRQIQIAGNEALCNFEGSQLERCRLLKRLTENNFQILEFKTEQKNLEDVFMELTDGVSQ